MLQRANYFFAHVQRAISPAALAQLAGYAAPEQLAQQLPDLGAADGLFVDWMQARLRAPSA